MLTAALFSALCAFAANSVLCRLALAEQAIDPAGFTLVRLLAGAIVLAALVAIKAQNPVRELQAVAGNWRGASSLFIYAMSFSLAYVTLSTATGALVLFGSVQLTMVLSSWFGGSKLSRGELAGLLLASSGLAVLLLPGITTPSAVGFGLMVLAGIAWGFYTLNGRQSDKPLFDTAGNFIRTIPMLMLTLPLAWPWLDISSRGLVLAMVSGAIASGLGYVIWYYALPALTSIQAGVLQLAVPLLAALGGVIFVNEAFTLRFAVAALLTLGGIAIVLFRRGRTT